MKLIGLILIVGFIFWYKPFDECRDYSDFTCKQIEKAEYDVWFYFDKYDKGYNLGHANGLFQCRNIARDYAYKKNLNYGWSYVCCMKANGSNCYEKHR